MDELLKGLLDTKSPSGNEGEIGKIIEETARKYCDELSRDSFGSIIACKKGDGKKLMLCAHMDEVGIIATFIDENGFVRFSPVGVLSPYDLLYREVEFLSGARGVIACEEKVEKKELKLKNLYIDIGVKSEDEAFSKISIGDMATFVPNAHSIGGRIFSKGLDNKIGCYVLLKVMERLEKSSFDLYFVFSVQEEVGLRGAKTAAFMVAPDYAVAVDVTLTGDTPESEVMAVSLAKGPAIKVMDRSAITDQEMRERLFEIAKDMDISLQSEVLKAGGSDTGAIQVSGPGVKTCAVSIPTRYVHTANECVDESDVLGVIDLLCSFIEKGM